MGCVSRGHYPVDTQVSYTAEQTSVLSQSEEFCWCPFVVYRAIVWTAMAFLRPASDSAYLCEYTKVITVERGKTLL